MQSLKEQALSYFQQQPIMAILRGLTTSSAKNYGEALYKAGIKIIEVPLTHPGAIEVIKILVDTLPSDCIVGAGTVTQIEQVEDLASIGAKLIVSPHTDKKLIRKTTELNLLPMPGIVSPTEAMQAIQAGAIFLKVFPAESFGPSHIAALTTILPNNCQLIAVGGIKLANKSIWLNSGARGLGIGTDIFSLSDTYQGFLDKLELI